MRDHDDAVCLITMPGIRTWAKRHRMHVEATHLLVRSKLVEMAFSVIGMLVSGRFKLYSNGDELHSVLRAEVPDFKVARSSRNQRPRGAPLE